MVVYSKIFCGGSEITDTYNYSIVKSTSDNNQSSSFNANVKNYNGIHKDDWIVGDEILIYADKDAVGGSPYTLIFTGILEDKKFTGKEQKETLVLTGRDYSARLMDRTVEPEVYNSLPAGSIVKDIVLKYTEGITSTNVQNSPITIDRIAFNQTPVYDAIKKLADLAEYTFYVDNDKDLHFEEKSSTSSGYTFDNTNIIKANVREQRDTVYNQIWVYGDRYLDAYKETFTANGGSAFNLIYNPHNTAITVGGSTIQPGAIEGISIEPGSNVKYMVSYNDKKITFVSGALQGNNIPTSGNTVIINYDRSLPIVKVGDNIASKDKYNIRVKVITDKDIKDPVTAEQLLISELERAASPSKEGTLDVLGVVDVTAGNTCIVDIPYHGINNQTYDILQANYDFSKENNLADDVLSLKVNKKIPDITDTMKDILLQIRKLQSQDISSTDLLTRYQTSVGSVGIRQSGIFIYESEITGSACYLYDTSFIPPTNPWHLASGTNQGFLSGEPVGSAFGPFIITWSGGFLT